MHRLRIVLSIAMMVVLFLTSCAKPHAQHIQTSTSNMIDTVRDQELKIFDWMFIDTLLVNDCAIISSINMKLDTNMSFSVFPFVALDRNCGCSLFFLVSLKRPDMLYMNALAIGDNTARLVPLCYVEHICSRENFESILFVLDPEDTERIKSFDGKLSFYGYGLLGSTSFDLDSIQTANLVELVKLSE